jgi:hypothetical protein
MVSSYFTPAKLEYFIYYFKNKTWPVIFNKIIINQPGFKHFSKKY